MPLAALAQAMTSDEGLEGRWKAGGTGQTGGGPVGHLDLAHASVCLLSHAHLLPHSFMPALFSHAHFLTSLLACTNTHSQHSLFRTLLPPFAPLSWDGRWQG